MLGFFDKFHTGILFPSKTTFIFAILLCVLSGCSADIDDALEADNTAGLTSSLSSVASSASSAQSSLQSSITSSITSSLQSSSLSSSSLNNSSSQSAASSRSGERVWQHCAAQHDYCFYEGVSQVRYGANDTWVTLDAENEIYCSDKVFGDPLRGVLKTCQVLASATVITPERQYWHMPSTWPSGSVPKPNTDVVIEAGQTVYIDRPINPKTLVVNGSLVCLNRDLTIDTMWLMVHGEFICGTEQQPYNNQLTITLHGQPDAPEVMGMGNKVLGVMNGGLLSLHGKPDTTNWLHLNATAKAGDVQLVLSEPPQWQVGDTIVIASSTEDMNQAQVRTITAVSGVLVTLNSPLDYAHFGEVQTFSNRNGASWSADTRAEVGLLSRNITIRGDDSSATTKHGAHVMSMQGGEAYIDNVAFHFVGQESLLGRYPFHWHLAGNVDGQYIRNSSIYNSYNRCVTIHQTDYAKVENNVCYNHIGHGYFLEDGVERFNTLSGNLSVNAVRPTPEKAVLESDYRFDRSGGGPGNFWITHPTNTVINNVAAGGEGTGFWYFLPNREIKSVHGVTTRPDGAEYLAFHNNTAHSMPVGFSSCRYGNVFGWESPNIEINHLLVYMITDSGLWPCTGRTHVYNNFMALDAGRHGTKAAFTAPNGITINQSLFVSNSKLADLNGGPIGRTAYGHYDQGSIVKDSHFVNYNKAFNSGLMGFVGGAVKRTRNRTENITFSPANYDPYPVQKSFDNHQTIVPMTAMHDDNQGTLTGFANHTIVPWHFIFSDLNDCQRNVAVFDDNHGAAVCDFRMIRARTMGISSTVAQTYHYFRRDAEGTLFTQTFKQLPQFNFIQGFAVPNKPYHFGIDFIEAPSGEFTIKFDDAWPGDRVTYELRNISSRLRIHDFRLVDSAQALIEATDNVYWVNNSTLSLRVTIPDGTPWFAGINVKFYENNQ